MEHTPGFAEFAQGGRGINGGFVPRICVYAELLEAYSRRSPKFVQ